MPQIEQIDDNQPHRSEDRMTLPVVHPQHQAKLSAADASDGFTPTKIIEVELTAPLPSTPFDGQHRRVWILSRLCTEPIGLSAAYITEEGITPNQLGALLWGELREHIVKRFLAAGLAEPVTLTSNGLKTAPDLWPYLRSRAELLSDAPSISVVVCTVTVRPN